LGLEYASFGLRDDLKEQFGEAGEKIQSALDAVLNHKMALPVYASTASVNREVEKQSDMMMTQVMERYHNGVAAMLQAINNPMIPEQIKQYTMDALEAGRTLMKATLRHFGQDEVDRLVPEIPKVPPQGGQPGQPVQGPSQLGSPQGPSQMGGGMPMVPPTLMPQGGGKIQ
jgi:hypothetical protein